MEIAPLAVSFAKTVRFGSTTAVKNFKKSNLMKLARRKTMLATIFVPNAPKRPREHMILIKV